MAERNTWYRRKRRWSQYYSDDPPKTGITAKVGLGTKASLPFAERAQPYAAPVVEPTLAPPPTVDQLGYNNLYGSTLPGVSTIASNGGGGGGGGGALANAAGAATGGAAGIPQDPWTGFAGRYAGVASDFFDSDPQIFVRDAMKAAGFDPNDGLMELMEDKAGMLQFLAMLGMGADPDSLNDVTPENYINFINQWTKDMLTPGKGSGDIWGMVGQILDAPEGSALNAYLQDGTPQQQAEALNTLVSVATASLPSVFRQAIGGMMEDQTNDWLSNKAKGKKGILADFLGKGGLLG
jgi:hypothetical protein